MSYRTHQEIVRHAHQFMTTDSHTVDSLYDQALYDGALYDGALYDGASYDGASAKRFGWVFCLGVVVSVLLHLIVLLVLDALRLPRREVAPPSSFEVQLLPFDVNPDQADVTPAQREEEVAAPVSRSAVIPAPSTIQIHPEEEVKSSPPESVDVTTAPPARKSIRQMTDEYLSTHIPSAAMPPAEIKHDNIFSPALRQALEAPVSRRRDPAVAQWLNNSSVADVDERVALDGKCFRLDDLGGGGDRRAWYPVKCRGNESTSERMARSLMEALDRR